jgi:septum formation protein
LDGSSPLALVGGGGARVLVGGRLFFKSEELPRSPLVQSSYYYRNISTMGALQAALPDALAGRFAKFAGGGGERKVILGSSSSSRRAIMDELVAQFPGLAYEVVTADIDEKALRDPKPEVLVAQLAHAKADAIVAKLRAAAAATATEDAANATSPSSPSYLITCDQVVVHEGRILEKPETADEARAMIRGYTRDAPASTVGAVVVTRLPEGERHEALEVCVIRMEPLPEEDVEALVAEGEVMWCAGGLMVEHERVAPRVVEIEGGGDDAVRGLGRATVARLLCEAAGVVEDQ